MKSKKTFSLSKTGPGAMPDKRYYEIITYFIAGVWLVNGLFCKLLNLVPRHELIVARILGTGYSRELTVLIGAAELGMAIWILSKIKSGLNSILQIAVVGTMNIIEFFLAPDLLLWGRFNILFAFLFIILIYYNEFRGNRKISQQA